MNEGFYFYIVQCADSSYYIGHTDNLEQRICDHNMGKYIGYTLKRLPVKLVYFELFPTRDEAFVAEHKIKRWSRKKKEILIHDGWNGFTCEESVRMDFEPSAWIRLRSPRAAAETDSTSAKPQPARHSTESATAGSGQGANINIASEEIE